MSGAFKIVGVKDDGHRAVIDKMNVHHGAEFSGGLDEAGTATFAAIGVKGELGDGQDGANRVEDGAVHFAVVVIEYAEVDGLAGEKPGVLLRVVFGDTDKDYESVIDGSNDVAVNGDMGVSRSLYYQTQWWFRSMECSVLWAGP